MRKCPSSQVSKFDPEHRSERFLDSLGETPPFQENAVGYIQLALTFFVIIQLGVINGTLGEIRDLLRIARDTPETTNAE